MKKTWTSVFARAQRGVSIINERVYLEDYAYILKCGKTTGISLSFGAFYDINDIEVQGYIKVDEKRYPLLFKGEDRGIIASGTALKCDPICFTESDKIEIHYQLYSSTPICSAFELKPYDNLHSLSDNQLVYSLMSIDIISTEKVIVAFGDSITEQGNWTSLAAKKLKEHNYNLLNLGISGNRLLRCISHAQLGADKIVTTINNTQQIFGLSGLDRLENDIKQLSNIDSVIIALGINDLYQPGGNSATIDELPSFEAMISGYTKLIEKLRGYQVRVIVATLSPFQHNSRIDEAREALRQKLNAWLSDNSLVDGCLDFAAYLVDANGQQIDDYYNADCLHPNAEGGKQMVKAFEKLELWK